MFPRDPAEDTELLMRPLFERGRARLVELEELRTPENRRIGMASLSVVRADDMEKNFRLCMRHVTRTMQPIHILCEDGSLCAQLAWKRP